MSMSYFKSNPWLSMVSGMVITLPAPTSASILWSFGSLLGLFLGVQVVSGLFLAMHYVANSANAFDSVVHICNDVNMGWLFRVLHANGASFYFIFIYLHIGRGLYFQSYVLSAVWGVGVTIFLLSMATAFLGYVLPWGQMSFWGATVITNLISAVPYIGESVVEWLWGGYAVSTHTLTRFFTLHYILPFVVLAMVMIHLLSLHESGSSSSLLVNSNYDKIPFHPYFSVKDVVGFVVVVVNLVGVMLIVPYVFSDPDNFIPANPLATPLHIKPEWYFLFAYAILRAIPNKLGGVVMLVLSVIILYSLMLCKSSISISNSPCSKSLFWMFIFTVVILTWVGGNPVEPPFIEVGVGVTIGYFMWFLMVILGV